jgi:hypothetical protein
VTALGNSGVLRSGRRTSIRISYYEEIASAVIVLREPGPDTVGEVADEDLNDPAPTGVVLHREDAGEQYEIEIYSGVSASIRRSPSRSESPPGRHWSGGPF